MRLESEVADWFPQTQPFPKQGRVHFVGIGGAGMSSLARILLRRGFEVSGSDLAASKVLNDLSEMGAYVQVGHSESAVEGASAVVVSDAVPLDHNPETVSARSRDIPMFRRSQALRWVLQGFDVLAVTGSHGKSTTTAILSQVLIEAGLDPLCIVGADVQGFEGNVRFGSGRYAVVEACEAYDGFHDIEPHCVVITNLEPEHLDHHKTWETLKKSVGRFATSAQGTPKFTYCANDPGCRELADETPGGVPYGLDIPGSPFSYANGCLIVDGAPRRLKLIGRHNAENAVAALQVAEWIGIKPNVALNAVLNAVGCRRRLERIAEVDEVRIYDDYAHHPAEIRASLAALREAESGPLTIVYQPHLYTRTRDFLDEFAHALSDADRVVLTDIYPARESPIPGVSSAVIAERLEQLGCDTHYVSSRFLLPRFVADLARPGDVIVGMGAGNIDAFAPDLVEEIHRKGGRLRVGVFGGGESAEREVSLLSAANVSEALRRRGYQVAEFDPTELLLDDRTTGPLVGLDRPDIVFIALHGTGGEDGNVQGLLETLHLPYTGAGVAASALAMDKQATKRILAAAGIPVPEGVLLRRGDPIPDFPLPCVVKPNAQGSTVGLGFASSAGELAAAVEVAFRYDHAVLIEQLIEGIEISIPVLGDQALPAVEIRPRDGKYDFVSKYTPGATEEIAPARISRQMSDAAAELAIRCHNTLGCLDVSRTDMIVTDDRIVVLEVNTVPGMTATSLVPKSAEAAGISFDDLCERILLLALKRYGIAKKK